MGGIGTKEVSTNLMATSYETYKKEITNYLKNMFGRNAKILDVGAGEGTYLPFLEPYFENIEAVEVFKPNIDNYDLEKRYKKVYNVDIRNFKYDYYDIIIFGDVIEHLEVKEAQEVLKYALNRCNEMIVAVPYLSPQGIEEDNIYEIHKQDDLTNEIINKRYPYLKNVYKDDKYGYYIKGGINLKNYVVRATRNFNDVVEKTENGTDTPRIAGQSVWNCTKERYEFLKENNAVILVGIDEIKEEKQVEDVVKEEKTKVTKKKKSSKK